MSTDDVWFEADDVDSTGFIAALRNAATRLWPDCGIRPDDAWLTIDDTRMIIAVDVVDRQERRVLMTWRADLDDGVVHAGRDPTHQLVGPLGDDAVRIEATTPAAVAAQTAAWFATQLRRGIDRYEWDEPATRCWVDVGSGAVLVSLRDGHPPLTTAARVVRVAGVG